ncbi:MAG: type II toxin-antitoxin system HicB family antitoxin [Terriglobales bacterium]
MQAIVQATFQLFGTMKEEDGWYIAHCPPLDITTQGRTPDEARNNLIEAADFFVVSCFERGTFEQALRELGWHVVAGRPSAADPAEPPKDLPSGGFRFPVPVPFGFEKVAAGCRA